MISLDCFIVHCRIICYALQQLHKLGGDGQCKRDRGGRCSSEGRDSSQRWKWNLVVYIFSEALNSLVTQYLCPIMRVKSSDYKLLKFLQDNYVYVAYLWPYRL